MNELIYYPGFEVTNINWLKFALLYINKLNPIIPQSGDMHLTDLHRKLYNETDLIKIHRPNDNEGFKSTLDAIDIIEKILRYPKRYYEIFKTTRIKQKWQDKEKHNFTLFRQKYTGELEKFSLNNKIGQKCDKGLLVPKELGLIYMTILAQTIADFEGISPITDYEDLDKFSILIRKTNKAFEKHIKVVKSILQLKLPANFNRLDLDKIIAFRNRKGFKARLNAFHKELDIFYSNIENGSTIYDFVHTYETVWNDFSGDLLQLGLGVANFSLGVWILVNSPEITTTRYIKEIVIGGSLLTVGSIISISNTWKNTRTKRYCRKYLANLTKL